MLVTFDSGVRDLVVLAALVTEGAQQIARGKQAHGATGDILLRDHARLKGIHDVLVGTAAIEIAARLQRFGDRLDRYGGNLVVFVEVPDRPAVRNKMSLKAPVAAKLFHQHVACAAGLTVCTVIRAHYRLYPGFLYKGLERGEIGLFEILLGGNGVEAVTQSLRAAVHRKVLGTGCRAQGLALALKASDKGFAEPGGQVGVFAVGLMAAPPSGITEDIDIRGPHVQSVVNVAVALF